MVKYSDNIKTEYSQYLDDESGIAQGTTACRIWFPKNHEEVVEVVTKMIELGERLTISGGGTGISGGRAPSQGWILATDEMVQVSGNHVEVWTDPETGIEYGVEFFEQHGNQFIRVPVGMTLKAIQNCTRERGYFYPPDPTERSSFIGGNVATNASGARSFKFGATREWVYSLTIVLASGESVVLTRDDQASESSNILSFESTTRKYDIKLPDLEIPNVTKHVAGPVLTDTSQPLDIFIGTNGIFGVITEVTLKLLPAPSKIISMFAYCDTVDQAIALIRRCQQLRSESAYPIPMSVEYLDRFAIKIMQQKDSRVVSSAAMILLEQDVYSDDEEEQVLEAWNEIFVDLGIEDVSVALSHAENEHHKFLRHWVPEWLIKTTKEYGYPIFVSDTSVPTDRFKEFMDYLYDVERRFRSEVDEDLLCTSILGHVGDNHPHLAMIPTNESEAALAQELLTEVIEKSVDLGGSMASEHGLGKKMFDDQPAIVKQYGMRGIDQVRLMKEQLDPNYRLCPDNIIPLPT